MKQIYLKKGMVNGVEMTTQDLIKLCLDNPPQGGFNFKAYKERARVESAMDKVQHHILDGDFFALEDRDFENLKHWVDTGGWVRRDPFLLDFIEQFQKVE
jgi:hypothetical protein